MWSICKKDFNHFFSSLTGYITISLFLLTNGIFLFILKDSSIFDYGYASLDKFFDLAPWVLLFLVPAISMRSFSEEFKTGTFETLQTSPVTYRKIVMGKYMSVILILFFVIVPTIIYAVTIQSLCTSGSIDVGAIAGSYLGLFLLAATFAAVGICCSGHTSNALVAFLVSAFICLGLYFGCDALSKISFFQGNADYYIEMFGIDFHYRSISRGVLDTRDVIYFGSIIMLALFITEKKLQSNNK